MVRGVNNGGDFKEPISSRPVPKKRKELEPLLFDFFDQFKDSLAEYVRESVTELTISELRIDNNTEIFSGISRGKARIKNQGDIACYVSTNQKDLGYRLDPGEVVDMFVNNGVWVTTISGSTDIGFIKY